MVTQKTGLIVDDSKRTQRQLAEILTDCGFDDLDVASNGAEALEKFQGMQQKPAIIRTCLISGAKSFILKPFHSEKVKEVIRHVTAA